MNTRQGLLLVSCEASFMRMLAPPTPALPTPAHDASTEIQRYDAQSDPNTGRALQCIIRHIKDETRLAILAHRRDRIVVVARDDLGAHQPGHVVLVRFPLCGLIEAIPDSAILANMQSNASAKSGRAGRSKTRSFEAPKSSAPPRGRGV
jgi:hypothetical protein